MIWKEIREYRFFLGNLPDGSDIDASNIRVNPELSNFNKIAISTDPTERGNGEIIKKYIDDLKDKKFSELDGSTFEVYYRNVILDLGIDGNQASTIVQNQNSLLKEISDRKSSISGVSLEEEITDMINYQHSYIANTRVFNVIDEMMDLIINRMVQ
jgi:flagellar hook-associated protein 1 FlgK